MALISDSIDRNKYRKHDLPSMPSENGMPVCPICESIEYDYLVIDSDTKKILGCSDCTEKMYREDVINHVIVF